MRLLCIDTETTGLEPDTADVIEIACALYDTGTRSLLCAHSWLLPGPAVTPESVAANGITEAMLDAAVPVGSPLGEALTLADLADVVVAHNAPFDRKFLAKLSPRWDERAWIDSERDLTFRHERGSKRLIHLAADNGVWMPGHHRALADVMMLLALLGRLDDLEAQIRRALKPRVTVMAVVPFERKDEAKARGFGWNATARRWEKAIPEDELEALAAEMPFPVRVVAGARSAA